MKNLSILLMLFILASCAGNGYLPQLENDYDHVYETSQESGLVIGSITYEKNGKLHPPLGYSLYYRGPIKEIVGSIKLVSEAGGFSLFGVDNDFSTIKGNIFVLELPIGTYEIYSWLGAQTWGSGNLYLPPRTWNRSFDIYPPITFEVMPGKRIYIGEIKSEITGEKPLGGLKGLFVPHLVNKATTSVKDNYERDMAALKDRYRHIPSDGIINRSMYTRQ